MRLSHYQIKDRVINSCPLVLQRVRTSPTAMAHPAAGRSAGAAPAWWSRAGLAACAGAPGPGAAGAGAAGATRAARAPRAPRPGATAAGGSASAPLGTPGSTVIRVSITTGCCQLIR